MNRTFPFLVARAALPAALGAPTPPVPFRDALARYMLHDAMRGIDCLAATMAGTSVPCVWARGFKFSGFVRPRSCPTASVKTRSLPDALSCFDLDER